MTFAEYQAQLADSLANGWDALTFVESCHLWALGHCVPAVRRVPRWKAEFNWARQRWGSAPRFLDERRAAIGELQAAQAGARWPEWAVAMARDRYGVALDPSRIGAWQAVRDAQRCGGPAAAGTGKAPESILRGASPRDGSMEGARGRNGIATPLQRVDGADTGTDAGCMAGRRYA